ncbi:hypothetical protein DFH06DRAFT_693203 [Mycena polygramma]|nr:hypothetical protein DFH06DRAFT_693203 [Mycena polygramma]
MATPEPSNMPTDAEPSSSDTLNVKYFLRNSGHRPAKTPLCPFEIAIDPSSTVLQLWTAIQQQHGELYLKGDCEGCPGVIIVMALWLVDHTGLDKPSAQELLWNDMGLGKEGPLYPPENNPRRGIVAMQPAEPLSAYSLKEKEFRVVVEATFKIEVLPMPDALPSDGRSRKNSQSRKRQGSPLAAESSATGKRQRSFGGPTCPVHVTGQVSDASRILFPEPNSAIPLWLGSPGTAFLDKTRFISLFYNLLKRSPRIGVWSPSGTAKTATLHMLSCFFDSQCPQETRDAFRSLEIGEQRSCGEGEYICLIFDFQLENMEAVFRSGKYKSALNAYLSKTLKAFVKKYQKQLGLLRHEALFTTVVDDSDPHEMLRQVFVRAKTQSKTIFIGIDNFDACLLTSLATIQSPSRRPKFWDEAKGLLEKLLRTFVAASSSKLLVFGQLPVVGTGLKSLPSEHALQSALTMTDDEMEDLLRVIAGGIVKLDRTKMRGLEKKVNHRIEGPRQTSHNFNVFLHYLARNFDRDNYHNSPASSPLLQSMLENQPDLFVYLRQ